MWQQNLIGAFWFHQQHDNQNQIWRHLHENWSRSISSHLAFLQLIRNVEDMSWMCLLWEKRLPRGCQKQENLRPSQRNSRTPWRLKLHSRVYQFLYQSAAGIYNFFSSHTVITMRWIKIKQGAIQCNETAKKETRWDLVITCQWPANWPDW